MKKCLCFYAACLILGVGLVVAELPINFAWAGNLGDCTESQIESNADCDNPAPCVQQGCHQVPGGTAYFVASDVRNYGNCHNGLWDWGCINCKKYYCAKGAYYSRRDAWGQCQDFYAASTLDRDNACIPL